MYDVSVSDLRESRQVEVSELRGTDGVLEVGKRLFRKSPNDRSMYHGRQHLGKASVNETTCKIVILLTYLVLLPLL